MSKIDDIIEKLTASLQKKGWRTPARFFQTSYFKQGFLKIMSENSEKSLKLVPKLKYIIKPFEVPSGNVRVVIIRSAPYFKQDVANGLAYSSFGETPQKPLQAVFKKINKIFYTDVTPIRTNPDLSDWVSQGVLLLNKSLTTTEGMKDAHQDFWSPLYISILNHLNAEHTGLIYVLVGSDLDAYAGLIDEKLNTILTASKVEDWDYVLKEVDSRYQNIYGEKFRW